MTKKKENTITVKQSNNLGLKLTDVRTGLQALRQHSDTLMLAKHAGADNGLLRLETDNFLETVFDMLEIYSNELDRIAFYLLECDNPEELRSIRGKGKRGVNHGHRIKLICYPVYYPSHHFNACLNCFMVKKELFSA